MAKTEIKSRMQQKHDVEANWTTASNATKPFVPLQGEIIIYDADNTHNYQRMKVGDGTTSVEDLSFIGENQNAFSNIKVGSTTVAADSATDTVEFVGNNVTITPDATNDKVTFAVASGSTSTAGIVKLTDSVSSTSTTTAATPKNVKAAYDLANTAKTKADSAYTLAESKVDSLSDLGITATATELNKLDGVTATTAELNYMDGVTSNVQTQLNGKVPTSRTVNGKALSSNISLSASDVGALSTNGGTINGNLNISGTSAHLILTDTDTNTQIMLYKNAVGSGDNLKDYGTNLQDYSAVDGLRDGLILCRNIELSKKLRLIVRKDDDSGDTSYYLYGTHNKPTASDVGAVPTSRTVNGKALSSNITLSASDVGARASSWLPTIADIGAAPAGYGLGVSGTKITEDLDTIYGNGFYYWGTAPTHAPFDWGYMINIQSYGEGSAQIAFSITDATKMVIRLKTNHTWGNWVNCSPSAFAPAGYGLGADPSYITFTEADATFSSGWYRFSDSITINGNTYNYGYMRVDAYNRTACTQTVYIISGSGVTYKRWRSSSNWSNWVNVTHNMLDASTYGTTLPAAGTAGRIFFKKVSS